MNHKKTLIFLLAAIIIGGAASSCKSQTLDLENKAAISDESEVTYLHIEDAELRKYLKDNDYVENPSAIKLSELENYNSFTIDNVDDKYNIKSLNGLEKLENIEFLNIINCKIENYDAIGKMDMSTLWITDSPFNDVDLLNNLNHLEELKLINVGLEKFPKLNLNQLSILKLVENNIKDLSNVKKSNLPQLKELNLAINEIENIEALNSLTKLRDLSLSENKITKISTLEDLVKLKDLTLAENLITDISGLEKCYWIENLRLSSNNITDLNAFASFTNLAHLDLENNSISDITPICGLEKLDSIDLNKNNISDLTPLMKFKSIGYLNLSNNPINYTITIGDEDTTRHINQLDISNCNLKTLDFIKNYEIKDITASKNNLKNLNGIQNIKGLKTLDVSSNHISNIDDLEYAETLNTLYLNENQLRIGDNEQSILGNSSLELLNISYNSDAEINLVSDNNSFRNLDFLDISGLNISPEMNFKENLPQIKTLYAENCSFKSTKGLECGKNLEMISLNNSKINDFSFLNRLSFENLESLSLSNTGLKDLSFLKNSTKILRDLDISKNNIIDLKRYMPWLES